MRLGRLAVLLTVFAGISVPAAAQYTTKGGTSGFTSKSTEASAPAKTQAAAAAPAKGTTSGFTSRSAGTSVPARAQARPAAGQAVFRPRPKEEKPPENTAEDDELPSFEALEGKSSETVQENVPPPPPPKGEIWVYISGFEYRDLTGMTMNCTWKVIVQNRTDTPVDRLVLSYKLLDLDFVLRLPPIEPMRFSEKLHAVYSEKCPAMAHLKPKVSVKNCKIGPLTDQECTAYIVVK